MGSPGSFSRPHRRTAVELLNEKTLELGGGTEKIKRRPSTSTVEQLLALKLIPSKTGKIDINRNINRTLMVNAAYLR